MAPLDHTAIRAIIAGIMLAMFLSALEQTIVAPALPAIGKSLGDIDDLSWVVTAYLLALTATTPLFGKLSDIYGRRAILLLAIGIFIIGSIACALGTDDLGAGSCARSAGHRRRRSFADRANHHRRSALAARAADGAGPHLDHVHERQHSRSGARRLLTDHLHWSLIFWINVPLGAVALVMTERALRRLPRNDRPHKLDVIGAALMVGAAIALMLALAWAARIIHGARGGSLTLIAGSAALWVLFALRLLTAREPFIPLAILHGRVTSTITVRGIFLHRHGYRRNHLHAAVIVRLVLGVSASLSGLALIAYMGGATLGSMVTGRLVVQHAPLHACPDRRAHRSPW